MSKIRLSKSSVGDEEREAVSRVIDGEFLGMGTETKSFEDEIQRYIGGHREVISVNSGTSALNLALSCLDIGPGDEVIVPSLTYVASYQSIAAVGATPVSCDVQLDTGFICSKSAEKLVTKKTKAVMPVHYASQSRGLEAVYSLAKRHDLRVIEDAAHAFGCFYEGKKIGSFGDVVCFSFDGIKNITCGEGGAITTADVGLADRLRDARLLGVEKDTDARVKGKRTWTFDVKNVGYRYHLSNIMAAIGREQLKKIENFGKKRREYVARYIQGLGQVDEVTFFSHVYASNIPHILPIRVNKDDRASLREFLLSRGIETGLHYYPNHKLSLFSKSEDSCPNVEILTSEIITLPLHVDLTPSDIDLVVGEIKYFFNRK